MMAPEERLNLIGHTEAEATLARALDDGALAHGLLVSGPAGVGKATLAFRLARAALAPDARADQGSLAVDAGAPAVKRLLAGAHPDLLVLRRPTDEKTGRVRQEIPVDSARQAARFFTRTAGAGGRRVCIIDKADELNVAAANALLKTLEEPPVGAHFILLADAPSRVLPTVRSRCRALALRPVETDVVAAFLRAEADCGAEEAAAVAQASGGRPGRALALLEEGGAEAAELAERFLDASFRGSHAAPFVASDAVAGVKNDALWESFKTIVINRLSEAARLSARGEGGPATFEAAPETLIEAWEKARDWLGRGDALRLDRSQILIALAADLRRAVRGRA
ncbi:MAG: DNA polymerase III subunit delta' [Pseudomonadota bacterium]